MNRILITGAAGKVARSVRPHLVRPGREVCLTDRLPVAAEHAGESAQVGELADVQLLTHLLEGVETVVHFAGYPRETGWDGLIEANIVPVARLWDAAVAAGVKRIIHASSNHAVGYYPRETQIDPDVPPRPDSRYGVTKVFMEAVARMYADKYGIKAWGVRIGYCGPAPTEARMLSHWVHPEDLAALIEVGMTAHYHCEIVYGVSANRASWWDNHRAEELGYRPRHSADKWHEALAAKTSGNPVAERYQGGSFAADGHVGDTERAARAR